MIECTECSGKGCGACDDEGSFDLTQCPCAAAGRDTFALLDYAAMYRRGLPPVAGGVLDQSEWFLRAVRAIWHDEVMIRPRSSALE